MGLKDILEKMRLVEPDPGVRPAGSGGKDGPQSIEEILGTLPPPPRIDEAAAALPASAAGAGGEVTLPELPAVYQAAGVADPAHGYGIYKVIEIFASEGFAGLDPRARAAALQGFLKANPSGPVPIKDVIQDAIRRDQALDGYDEVLRKRAEARAAAIEQENAALQEEIDAAVRKHRERMESNRRALDEERRALAAWQTMKRAEERKLYDAVAAFVEPNPITLDPVGPPPGPGKPDA